MSLMDRSDELTEQRERVRQQLMRQIRMSLRRTKFTSKNYLMAIQIRVKDQLDAWCEELEIKGGFSVHTNATKGGRPGEVDVSWVLNASWRDKLRLHGLMCKRLLDEDPVWTVQDVERAVAADAPTEESS